MKTTSYKILFLFLLTPFLIWAGEDFNGKHTKQKRLNREFNVSPQDLLKVNNSYGNIDIITWDRNLIEIEVLIKTNGNDEEEVEKRLGEIEIEFNQQNGRVSAKTIISNSRSQSFLKSLFSWGSSNVNMEIHYRIKAPVTNHVDLSNDYGGIHIDKLDGNAKISCDYGKINIGELRGNNNELSFDYTRNTYIGFVKRARINADYSEFTIEEAGTLELSADYTESIIKKVENLNFSNDYGSLKVEKVKNFEGKGDYLSVRLGLVYSKADISMDYGSLSIQKIMSGLKELKINTDYTGVKIGYDPDSSFKFVIKTEYGSVKGMNNAYFTLNKSNQSGTDSFYEGYYRSANTDSEISINSSYGSVSFTN